MGGRLENTPREKIGAKHFEQTDVEVSVIIITFERPAFVRSCLQHLERVRPQPSEVLVVDASADEQTSEVVQDFPFARCLRVPENAGRMTTSRNHGLLHANGEVIAFLDDDANARETWLRGLLDAFSLDGVDAVAGRTCNGISGEEHEGVEEIGRLLRTGALTGNFAADPACVVDVDHGIGANMAFRRHALARLGGFRDDFRGIGGVREDTDVFLRLRAVGSRAVFAPVAVVDHVGAPHVIGRRFDYRYVFWARHNHALLLARNLGLGSREFRTWVWSELRDALGSRHPYLVRRVARMTLGLAAVLAGVGTSLLKSRWRPADPVRQDVIGRAIARHLARAAEGDAPAT
jgi:GT2 family glycosyltransferase